MSKAIERAPRRRIIVSVATMLAVMLFAMGGPAANAQQTSRPLVSVDLKAGGKGGWNPAEIRVNRGTEIMLTMTSIDGDPHSFSLEDHDFEVPIFPGMEQKFNFVADKPGSYVFYCGNTNCKWHAEMVFGELVVE